MGWVPRAFRAWFVAGGCALAAGCQEQGPLQLERARLEGVGSARLVLPQGSLPGGTGTLVLSGEPRFTPLIRQLQLRGPDAQRSVFFNGLLAGIHYRLELLAGSCRGEAEFDVLPNQTTQVPMQPRCAAFAMPQPDSSLPGELAPREPASGEPPAGEPPSGEPPAGEQAVGELPPGERPSGERPPDGQPFGDPSGEEPSDGLPPDAGPPPAEEPDCELIAEVTAQPPLQRGNTATSTLEVVLLEGAQPSSVEWRLMEDSSGVGRLFPSPVSGLAVSFDCARDGVAEVVVSVSGARAGRACQQRAQTQIECAEQGSVMVEPPAPSASGACGECSRELCSAQLTAVRRVSDAARVLSCVLGPGWSAGERAGAGSCGNTELAQCYCGSSSQPVCERAAPAELDGPCLDVILSGLFCEDLRCVTEALRDGARPAGAALSYVRCQQEHCRDVCFNL